MWLHYLLRAIPPGIRLELRDSSCSNACGSVLGFTHDLITPEGPNGIAFVESFNWHFRDECLNEGLFIELEDTRNIDQELEA